MAKKKISNLNEEFDVKLFAIIAQRNLWILILLLTIGLFGAFVYLRYTPPLYQSESLVKLRATVNSNQLLDLKSSNFVNDMVGQTSGDLEIFRSSTLLSRTLKKMPLQISYYSKGAVLISESYIFAGYRVEVNLKDSSLMDLPIAIEFEMPNLANLSFETKGVPVTRKVKVNKWSSVKEFDIKVTVSYPEIIHNNSSNLKKTSLFFTINNHETVVNKYIGKISAVSVNPAANIIGIYIKDNNPFIAADLANALVSEFNIYDKERRSASVEKSVQFISETLSGLEQDLKFSENLLEQFKTTNKVLDPAQIAAGDLNQINELINQKIDLQLELAALTRLEGNVKANKDLNSFLPLLSGGVSDNVISGILKTMQDIEDEIAKLKLQVTEDNAAVKAMKQRLYKEQQLLMSAISSSRSLLEFRIQSIDERILMVEGEFLKLPSKEAQLSRLKRIYDINEKFYSQLLEKKAEFSITMAGIVTNNIILEYAIPQLAPISPKRKIIIAASALVAFLIGFVIVFVKYLFYNEITSLDEINQYTDAALLGIIPKYKKEIPVSQLLIDKNPKSAISESFRSVRTNLQFISNDPGAKIVAITSTISGEGKTFVAINLAGVLAYSDKKVIIIDLDMRKPKIHLGFNFENLRGMSTILIGKDKVDTCINKSSLKNLDFITAGPIPPNPSELILSPLMNQLLDELKSKYDMIIVDTPPVGIVTDGVEIISKADYPIYIVRALYSKRMFIQNINKLMIDNKISKLSVVLNGVETSKFKYGYGYGYGYGYYDEESKKKLSRLERIKNAFTKS